ncbi:hypothetical protein BP6252_10008 [Coleophoma cylindrospora]|uniref:Zn(2)-C6 fungal-type domain-containing protein n=1 Tax=Coleophoma cylindrospora TaxID=1849047 RepID=A0A3D8QX17_9HELO|nr:hypothetical protein BP6252_10008 [Coleophoma cylindrospora]
MDAPAGEVRSPQQEERPKVKRTRVALACQRCRSRKQKCDGAQDSCSTCTSLGLRCHYKPQLYPRPDQKRVYISALEGRIAELESLLAGLGHDTVSNDHWRSENPFDGDGQTPQPDEDVVVTGSTGVASSSPSTDRDGNSTVSMGRVFSSIIKTRKTSASDAWKEEGSLTSENTSELVEKMGRMFVSPEIASRLLEGWIKYLSTQYPVIHTPQLRELHARRDKGLDVFEESILHLVYANSGRVLEVMGDTGFFYTDQHYEAALQNLDAVLELGDARSAAYLLLLALYCLRRPRDPGAWTLAGLAVRLCIELDMHRKPHNNSEITMERELNVRIFWSCYYLDRGVSVALGRPPAIADDDIDVEFPISIDEDVEDQEILRQAAKDVADGTIRPPSSLTPFIHFIELRRIESKIEHAIYRANKQTKTTSEVVQNFLAQLMSWKEAIPSEYYDRVNTKTGPYIGIDAFMIPFYKVVRLLLYPQLSEPDLNLHYLKVCADASAGICQAYKRLHRIYGADCSPFAVQSLFLSGLTLIHCTWLAPRSFLDVVGAITDCNLMLYVIAERCPPAQKYRDVFDRIKTNVIDAIAQGNHQSTRMTGILDNEMTERCRELDEGLASTVRTDYSQIISDLAKDRRRIESADNGNTARLDFNMLSGPMMDYGLGYAHGSFMDYAFMDNLEEFNGLMSADWELPSG